MRSLPMMLVVGSVFSLSPSYQAAADDPPLPCEGGELFSVKVQGSDDGGLNWSDNTTWIFGRPGHSMDVAVRTLMTVNSGETAGWSFGVKHDREHLQWGWGDIVLTAVTIEGTETETVQDGELPDTEVTEIRTGFDGFTQGVVVDVGQQIPLLPVSDFVTALVCYRITVPVFEGVYTADLSFDHDIGDPPIRTVVTQDGLSNVPCARNFTFKVFSSWSVGPSATSCPVSAQGQSSSASTNSSVDPREMRGPENPLTPGQGKFGTDFVRGDANVDSLVDISDAVFVLDFLFRGGPEPSCRDAADINDDEEMDLSDPIYLLGYLYVGTDPVPGPNSCGPDRTAEGKIDGSGHPAIADFLDCQEYYLCDQTDSDCDGLTDNFEGHIGTDPGDPQCDCFDSLPQGEPDGIPEVDCDGDGLPDLDGSGNPMSPRGWDTDGDNFSDGQEVLPTGVPGSDGQAVTVEALGADPLTKDIFIEMDWAGQSAPISGHNHAPPVASLQKVRAMFAARSINLHIDAGVAGFDMGEGGAFEHDEFLPGPDVQPAKAIYFKNDHRGRAFYYSASLHATHGGFHGQGEIGGDDFSVTSFDQPELLPNGIDRYALFFAHEFGHCLGFRHGGEDDQAGKVYYRSIMNYRYFGIGAFEADCLPACTPAGDDVMDYSDEVLGPFDESAVDEQRGLCVVDDVCKGNDCVPFDFNEDHTCSEEPYPKVLNFDGDSTDILYGFDDWGSLFIFKNSRAQTQGGSMELSDCTGIEDWPE